MRNCKMNYDIVIKDILHLGKIIDSKSLKECIEINSSNIKINANSINLLVKKYKESNNSKTWETRVVYNKLMILKYKLLLNNEKYGKNNKTTELSSDDLEYLSQFIDKEELSKSFNISKKKIYTKSLDMSTAEHLLREFEEIRNQFYGEEQIEILYYKLKIFYHKAIIEGIIRIEKERLLA